MKWLILWQNKKVYNETENKIKGLKYKDLKLQQHFINLKKEKKKIQVRYLKETVKVILLWQ